MYKCFTLLSEGAYFHGWLCQTCIESDLWKTKMVIVNRMDLVIGLGGGINIQGC